MSCSRFGIDRDSFGLNVLLLAYEFLVSWNVIFRFTVLKPKYTVLNVLVAFVLRTGVCVLGPAPMF